MVAETRAPHQKTTEITTTVEATTTRASEAVTEKCVLIVIHTEHKPKQVQ